MKFILSFLALLALAFAQDENPSPDMMLRTSDLQAYTSDAPNDGYSNWVAFLVNDDAHTMMATCSTASGDTLYSDTMWYPCKVYTSDDTMNLMFQVSSGFNELRLKKTWENNGMYMHGMAAQGTNWKSGDDGNETTMGNGTFFERAEPWAFEITNISGF